MFIGGTVSTIQPLKINPEFSHVVNLSVSLSDNTLLGGKEIKTIVESSDFQADKHFKWISYPIFNVPILDHLQWIELCMYFSYTELCPT